MNEEKRVGPTLDAWGCAWACPPVRDRRPPAPRGCIGTVVFREGSRPVAVGQVLHGWSGSRLARLLLQVVVGCGLRHRHWRCRL